MPLGKSPFKLGIYSLVNAKKVGFYCYTILRKQVRRTQFDGTTFFSSKHNKKEKIWCVYFIISKRRKSENTFFGEVV